MGEKDLTSGEIVVSQTQLTIQDAVNIIAFRMTQLGKKGLEIPLAPFDSYKMEVYAKTLHFLESLKESHSGDSLRDAYRLAEELALPYPNEATIVGRQKNGVVRELGDIVNRLDLDINKLTPEEREYILKGRLEANTAPEKTDPLLDKILNNCIARVHFSAVLGINGRNLQVGFQTHHSLRSSDMYWGKGYSKPARDLVNSYMGEEKRFPAEIAERLKALGVTDFLSVNPLWKRETRNGIGREKAKEENRQRDVFMANVPVQFGESEEGVVEILYQTITAETDPSMYTDENGRPGNMFLVEIHVPESIAAMLVTRASQDPNYVRLLMRSIIRDPRAGILANIRNSVRIGQSELPENLDFQESESRPNMRVDRGLPPYTSEDWRKSSMIMNIILKIPKEDVQGVEPAQGHSRDRLALLAQKLESMVVRPL